MSDLTILGSPSDAVAGTCGVRAGTNGAWIVTSEPRSIDFPPTLCSDLIHWAAIDPDIPFLAVRDGADWTAIGYGELLGRVRTLGAGLLRSPATADAPLAIIAENSIDYAALILAAMYVGIPFAPISTGYAGATADPQRLRELLDVLRPGLIVVPDAAPAARVRALMSETPLAADLSAFAGDPASADAAFGGVGADTVAKIMFTSGSTGTPKGVITTHGMLSANQTQTALAWPEVTRERPIMVDWLPWSHVMGGSHLFGMVLRNGGTYYIDPGRPVGSAFAETIRSLREIPPTMFFGVPRTFAMLLEALQADAPFARSFFSRLRGLGNAAAALPNAVRAELIRLARAHSPFDVRVTSSWGMTETAPFAATSWGPQPPDDDTIGTPAPAVSIKLAPVDGRFEMRVKGPNVTPGYWRNPEATRAAFDDEGYFRTGDAAELKDPADPARGLIFGGRLAENFKLSTGTWVNVGALRLALIDRGAPLIEDVVLTGHDTDAIGALIFVRADSAAVLAGSAVDGDLAQLSCNARVRAFIAAALAEHNAAAPASSTRITRALIVPEAPDRARGEVTDKGSINQRRALALRASAVAQLSAEPLDASVILPQRATVNPA